jgi:hypothetical protein
MCREKALESSDEYQASRNEHPDAAFDNAPIASVVALAQAEATTRLAALDLRKNVCKETSQTAGGGQYQ